jgi:hypothetical protein
MDPRDANQNAQFAVSNSIVRRESDCFSRLMGRNLADYRRKLPRRDLFGRFREFFRRQLSRRDFGHEILMDWGSKRERMLSAPGTVFDSAG